MQNAPCFGNGESTGAEGHNKKALARIRLAPFHLPSLQEFRGWEKAAVQRNIAQLRSDGVTFVEPTSGWLSCRQIGAGRMAEPETILAAIRGLLGVSS